MNFPKPKLTKFGHDLLIKGLTGEQITFTCVKYGDGREPEDYKELDDIVNPVLRVVLDYFERGDSYAILTFTFDNHDFEEGFWMREMGVYAQDPVTGTEKLYAYTNAGSKAGFIMPYPQEGYIKTVTKLGVIVGEAENVSAVIGEMNDYASKEDFEHHVRDAENPHKVTAKQVGLDKVKNVAPEDMEITYEMATENVELTSGEKLSVALGKIARAINSVFLHMRDKQNPHEVTAKQAGAAEEEHTHSMADITTGILQIKKGGTGAETASGAVDNFWDAIKTKITGNLFANNLTTNAAGWALDARQGKALKDSVDQLNTDLNNDNYRMGTYAQSGAKHGRDDYNLKCQYNRDGDGRFKLFLDTHETRVDCATRIGDGSGYYTPTDINKYCRPKLQSVKLSVGSDGVYHHTFDHDVLVVNVSGVSGHYTRNIQFGRTSGFRQWSITGVSGTPEVDFMYFDL